MRSLTVLVLTFLAASPVLAQRSATPVRAAPPQERPAQATETAACELTAPSGLRLAFQECGGSRSLAGSRAREIEVVEALDANPYARFISDAQGAAASGETLVEEPPEQLRGRTGAGDTVRLQGATLQGWSLDWTGNGVRQDRAQWTLEVRVNRIELA